MKNLVSLRVGYNETLTLNSETIALYSETLTLNSETIYRNPETLAWSIILFLEKTTYASNSAPKITQKEGSNISLEPSSNKQC